MNSPDLRDSDIVEVEFGERVMVVRPVNLYRCRIDEDVFIGPFVEIQAGARVGRGSRVQSHSFICTGVSIGADCFIGHGVAFINDTFAKGGPAGGDTSLYLETVIEDGVAIGSNATILPVTIAAGTVIGAVVTSSITEPGTYAGNPARKIRELPTMDANGDG